MPEEDAAPDPATRPSAAEAPTQAGRPPRRPLIVWLRRIGCAVLVLAVVCVVIVGCGIYRAAQQFAVEERMAWACHSIESAVVSYEQKHGRFPESLDQLVPEHLPAIPRAEAIQSVEYRLAEDQRAWAVTVRSDFGGQPRIYQLSSDTTMPPPPNAREIGFFHGITVYLSTEGETGAGKGRSP